MNLKKFPNLKFKSNIAKYLLDEYAYYRKINVFEVYICHKDNKEYLALPNNINLDIIQLVNNKKAKTLKGHEHNIIIVEYYINHKNYNNEYLISIESVNMVIIWDINNSYNKIHKFYESDDHTLVTCLLYFPYNSNEDYIITPMHDCDEEGTKVYSLKNCNLIKYIDTKCNYIEVILPWYNKKDKKDYIIQIAEEIIFVNNMSDDNSFYTLNLKEIDCNFNGFLYNKNNNDYLCVSQINGYIHIWDLVQKNIFKIIKIGVEDYLIIIKWNNKYTIGANNGLKVIDIENGQIVTVIKEKINYIKKLNHPIYGESIIVGDKKNISVWAI